MKYVDDHEPERIPQFPAVTMLYVRFTETQASQNELGPQQEVGWEWRIYVRTQLGNGKWKEGQRTARDLVAQLVALPHFDHTLGSSCSGWLLEDEGQEPDLGQETPGVLCKELRLTGWTYEVAS